MTSDGSKSVTTVSKNCTSLCLIPNIELVWSVNTGYKREAAAQVCCLMNNCNSKTLEGTVVDAAAAARIREAFHRSQVTGHMTERESLNNNFAWKLRHILYSDKVSVEL